MTAQTLDLLLLLVAVDITVVAGRLCKKRGAMYADTVAYGAHRTMERQLHVRTLEKGLDSMR